MKEISMASVLDRTDLDILAILGRDCRTSYRSIGSQVGLTSKSVKTRVKDMIANGVIEQFVVRVNPAAFGYKTANVSAKTACGISKDEIIKRVRRFGNLSFHVHQMGRVSAAGLLINELWDASASRALAEHLRPAVVKSIAISHVPVSAGLSETDMRIIRCLLQSGARAEVSEIAKELRISEKTTTRRLERMKGERLLDFSLQCNPAAMIGFIQFCIPIIVEKSHFRQVYERMYAEFQQNILFRPSIIDPDDQLIFVLFGENAFQVDSALARVDSFEGVKTADAFIVTCLQTYDDWITKEIDKRLPRKIVAGELKA